VQINRLTSLEREEARLHGERGQLIAGAAEAKGKITETELQILQVDQELSSDVAKELREIDSKIGEYVERKVTAEDQLKRTDIRAPQNGVVFQSTANTAWTPTACAAGWYSSAPRRSASSTPRPPRSSPPCPASRCTPRFSRAY
jgi:hypothetical protein